MLTWDDLTDLWETSELRSPLDRIDFEIIETLEGCGDICHYQLHVENGVIVNARHDCKGCVLSQAVAAYIVTSCRGMKLSETERISLEVDFHITRMGCVQFPFRVFRQMINGQTETEEDRETG